MARALSDYNAKRDFKITAEPPGKLGAAGGKSFVIQRHAATRLHYDLRLELEGVYKSWAVTKTPSLDPAVKRLAVEVEDHPVAYGTFEGTIPEGEYGGGTVQLWDQGRWQPQGPDASGELAKGHLKFVMQGTRMKGKWALIRLRDDKSKPGRKSHHNWLLIKEIDDEAKRGAAGSALEKEVTSVKTGRTLDEIAAKSTKVWHSNRTAKENVAALAMTKKFAKTNKSVIKKKARSAAEQSGKNLDAAEGHVQPLRAARNGKKIGIGKTRMPEFVAPQLARLVQHPPAGGEWAHEVKFDGYRVQARVEGHKAILRTRKGLDWTSRFPEIASAAARLPDCLIDGEICALNKEGASDFGLLQTALSDQKTSGLVFFLFDILFAQGHDLRGRPLMDRKSLLEGMLDPDARNLRYVPHFQSSGDAMLSAACQMSLEGVISKRLDVAYQSGRADSWLKSKCRGGQEVVIGGWSDTAGKFRSLLVGAHQNGKLVYMGRVGTGYNAKTAADLMAKLKKRARATSPFADAPHSRDSHWVAPDLVAEIQFANVTGDGLFRQAAFKGLRLDKPAAGIVPEVPISAPKGKAPAFAPRSAKPSGGEMSQQGVCGANPRCDRGGKILQEKVMPVKKSVTQGNGEVLGITISHPEKPLWPASPKGRAVTKLDLANYMANAAHLLLPHIANRPISVVRAPDGIGGELFFQRHEMKGTAARVLRIPVQGEKQPYLGVDSAEALVALAQQAATEIHPWGCKPGDPETPERIILDLDPAPDVPFERVIDAAQELRKRLTALGFVPFVKTTGGKGLHVVIAVKATPKNPVTWPDAKAFAKAIAMALERDAPDRFTTTIAKKARPGKIFVDYLRNDKTSTGVAPWSPRAREGAPIAVPITWAQVKKGLDPQAFTLLTAAPLLKRADPWKDIAKSAKPLAPAMKKLLGDSKR